MLETSPNQFHDLTYALARLQHALALCEHKRLSWSTCFLRFRTPLDDAKVFAIASAARNTWHQDQDIALYFFVRYQREYPELRVRFASVEGSRAATRAIRELGEKWRSTVRGDDLVDITRHGYHAEFARYGGRRTMNGIEGLFFLASEVALALHSEALLRGGGKISCAIMLNAVLLLTWFPMGLGASSLFRGTDMKRPQRPTSSRPEDSFTDLCERAWLANRDRIQRNLAGIERVNHAAVVVFPSWLRHWQGGHWQVESFFRKRLDEDEPALQDLHATAVTSLMHMLCNRLGLVGTEEQVAYVSALRYVLEKQKAQAT